MNCTDEKKYDRIGRVACAFIAGLLFANFGWVFPSAVAHGGAEVISIIALLVMGIFFLAVALFAE